MDPLKVCIVSSGLARTDQNHNDQFKENLDGTARIAHELGNVLCRMNHDVTVITDCPKNERDLPRRNYSVRTLGPRFSFRSMSKFDEIVEELKPDIVHFHGGEPMNYYAKLSKARTSLPTIQTFTFVPSLMRKSQRSRQRLAYALLRKALRLRMLQNKKLDHIIALTEHAKAQLVAENRLQEDKISIVRHGVPQSSLDRPVQDDDGNHGIVCISGTTKGRGFLTFLSSIPFIKSGFQGAKVTLAVRDRGDYQHARLVGQNGFELVGPSNLYDSVKSNSVVVMPFSVHSAVDPPLSMLECMAWGKQVVSTPIASIPETLAGGRGIVVPARDPSSLAKGVIELLSNQHLRDSISRRADDFVRNNYQWKTAVASILDVYHRSIETTRIMEETYELSAKSVESVPETPGKRSLLKHLVIAMGLSVAYCLADYAQDGALDGSLMLDFAQGLSASFSLIQGGVVLVAKRTLVHNAGLVGVKFQRLIESISSLA